MNVKEIIGPAIGFLFVVVGSFAAHEIVVTANTPTLPLPMVASIGKPVVEPWADPRDLMLRGCVAENDFLIFMIGSRALTDSSTRGMWSALSDEVRRSKEAALKGDLQVLYLRGDLKGCEEMSVRLRVLHGRPWSGTLDELRNAFASAGIREHLALTMPDAFSTVPPDTEQQKKHWQLLCRSNVLLDDVKRMRRQEFTPKRDVDAKLAACG